MDSDIKYGVYHLAIVSFGAITNVRYNCLSDAGQEKLRGKWREEKNQQHQINTRKTNERSFSLHVN